jgi:predicted metal-binding protein
MNRGALEEAFAREGLPDFKWIDPRADVVVAEWVRIKCQFGCSGYGRIATCPPNTPDVADCRAFLAEYRAGVLFHFTYRETKPGNRQPWAEKVNHQLFQVERAVFLANCPKAFTFAMSPCHLCADCPGQRAECRHAESTRPTPEALAIDVYTTAHQAGYPIQVLTDFDQEMNRYAILLVE